MVEWPSIKKLRDDLDYWIYIGIDSDLYECPDHRKEYKPLVEEAKTHHLEGRDISKWVLLRLSKELEKPWYNRIYMVYLCKLYLFNSFKRVGLCLRRWVGL
jgi:hypothetical protein